MKLYNNEKVIISLTSHKNRFFNVSKTVFSILNGTEKSVHIVLTIFKEDFCYLTEDIKLLLDNDLIELIIADENLKSHLKYYYAMKKYKDIPIITIDDDCLYDSNFVESLLMVYDKNKKSICARRVHEISNTKYRYWKKEISNNKIPSRKKLATGVGGILYPPNILDIDNVNLEELKKCITADDIYLKVLENRKNIDIQIVPCKNKHPLQIKNTNIFRSALSNVNLKNNDVYLTYFKKDIF